MSQDAELVRGLWFQGIHQEPAGTSWHGERQPVVGAKLGSLHPAKREGSILREGASDRQDEDVALTSRVKMELSREMVWFGSSDVHGRGADARHPRAGSGSAHTRTWSTIPSRHGTATSPPCCLVAPVPLGQGHVQKHGQQPPSKGYLHQIPKAKGQIWLFFSTLSDAKAMGSVLIYTSTIPKPEQSSIPLAVSLHI